MDKFIKIRTIREQQTQASEKPIEQQQHAQSLVAYRLTCETCKQTYIGKTERILAHRIKEHLNPKKDSAI